MFWVYILHCADGSYYTGHTDNLEKRMGQYHAGECDGYVAARRPVKLAWSQECATRNEALSAEQQIKGWGRRKKEAMMRGDWNQVSQLAKSKTVVRAESKISVRPDPSTLLRTKGLVEGQNNKAVRGEPVELQVTVGKSIHPSTSSGRTDLGSEA
jgi:predicted GIY-YIG superfamily endonuclease